MKTAKKPRILYRKDATEPELEEVLFGTSGQAANIFEREKEEGEETVAELIKQATRGGGLLHDSDLFFQDNRTTFADSGSSDDDTGGSDDDSGGSDDDSGKDTDNDSSVKDVAGASFGKRQRKATHRAGDSINLTASGNGGGSKVPSPSGRMISELGLEEDAAAEVTRALKRQWGLDAVSHEIWGTGGRSPVWTDPGDADLQVDLANGPSRLRKLRTQENQVTVDGSQYEVSLRKQHEALNPRTKWASTGKSRTSDADDDGSGDEEAEALLARAGGLVDRRPAGQRLPAGQLDTTRLMDANVHGSSDAVLQSVRFHPNAQVLLTAGLDKKLRLFHVDGVRNPLLQAIHLDDLPITCAAFASGGAAGGDAAAAANRVVLAGRRPFFYLYDMEAARLERVQGPAGCRMKSLERFAVSPPSCTAFGSEPVVAFTGDGGFIPLVSLSSRQWVANLRISGGVRALAFGHDGRELVSMGDDGMIRVWDMRTRRCRLAFSDMGNIGDVSSLALSPDGAYMATGAKSGVVNVYRWPEVEAATGTAATDSVGRLGGRVAVPPVRELMNLTTNTDTLVFSPDSQMLAMASRMKRDALRLVHMPSLTVFSNWPSGRSPLHYVHSVDFSPHCGLLSVGNAKGRALLYRLHHYPQA